MSDEAERALRHAVRPRVVLRLVGEIVGLVVGATALVPACAALLFGEARLAPPFAVLGFALIGTGLLARRLPRLRSLQTHEALVVTTAVFALTPLLFAWPLAAIERIGFLDALFEAVSGFTTTGLSTLDSVEARSRTFLLARALFQWVGGLGFVVFSLALTLGPGVAARRLGTPTLELADVAGSMRGHARRLLVTYLSLTGAGVALLLALGAGGFDAVVHSFAGVSTGGFAPRDASLAPLSRRLQSAVLLLGLLGAVSLPLYAELRRRRFLRCCRDVEARALLVLVALGALALFAATRGAGTGGEPAGLDLLLLAVSAQTTTGFSTIPVAGLPAAAQAIVILAMISGGSHGSTAGGVKLLRLAMMVRLVRWLISRTRLPERAVTQPTLAGEPIEPIELLRAAVVIGLFAGVLLLSWLPFLWLGYAPLPALLEVASATGTVGLSAGITRPELEAGLKGVLCLDMLLGRLEVFAVIVTLAPRTWLGRRAA